MVVRDRAFPGFLAEFAKSRFGRVVRKNTAARTGVVRARRRCGGSNRLARVGKRPSRTGRANAINPHCRETVAGYQYNLILLRCKEQQNTVRATRRSRFPG